MAFRELDEHRADGNFTSSLSENMIHRRKLFLVYFRRIFAAVARNNGGPMLSIIRSLPARLNVSLCREPLVCPSRFRIKGRRDTSNSICGELVLFLLFRVARKQSVCVPRVPVNGDGAADISARVIDMHGTVASFSFDQTADYC